MCIHLYFIGYVSWIPAHFIYSPPISNVICPINLWNVGIHRGNIRISLTLTQINSRFSFNQTESNCLHQFSQIILESNEFRSVPHQPENSKRNQTPLAPTRNGSWFFLSHRENYFPISFHIEWDMIVMTVFLSILNQIEFHLVQKIERKTVTTIISHSMWKEMEI